jgi:NAD+ diphosphatase
MAGSSHLAPEGRLRMKSNFVPSQIQRLEHRQPAWWFVLRDDKLLVSASAEGIPVPFVRDPIDLGLAPDAGIQYIGTIDNVPCCAAETSGDYHPPEGMVFTGLRRLFTEFGEEFFRIAGTASQLLTWDRTHRFCGACGTRNLQSQSERVKICPECGLMQFPRISPAVIVAVVKGDEILLAKGIRFRNREVFSVLAGFVEPGETLEECVSREIAEEVGIRVRKIKYFASQPWPFPHSLMVGFTAEYAGGTMAADKVEIIEAGWFSTRHMPKIPEKPSIARRLIDWFTETYP